MHDVRFVITPKVRHLAAWTRDQGTEGALWEDGAYRPLCGERARPEATYFPAPFPYADPKMAALRDRRSTCTRCVRVAHALLAIAERTTP